jgi:deoxyribodipyrimidine photo-lyase
MHQQPLNVVWFKRDLRVADHAPLMHAARRGLVLPLYIVEPELWQEPDASGRHWAFISDCLADLAADLAGLGQPLIIRVGDAVTVLEQIRSDFGVATLWSHEETGNGWTYARDRRVARWARVNNVPWNQPRQTGVQRRLASRNGWAQAWDQQMAEPVSDPPRGLKPVGGIESERLPTAVELGLQPDPCPGRQRGGRREALQTLDSFLLTRGQDYRRAMSSPLAGADACSRLSPFLAWGAVSMKETMQATWGRMQDLRDDPDPSARAWRGALSSYAGRLHWHCHFMQKLESEPRIEFSNMHRAYDGLRPDIADPVRLAAWSSGHTGFPFLDACMRSLNATGWLNFRMRAMVQSFASYNLWLPWRASGLHLARQFTDYEPGIHWSQSQMQSGTTGINTLRVYNVVKQGYDQDPFGVFVRRWIPELATLPDSCIHEPWRRQDLTVPLGQSYPLRIVDHEISAREARDKVYRVRGTRAFRREADAVQEQHGSRKSGIAQTGQRPRRKAKAKPVTEQLELKL